MRLHGVNFIRWTECRKNDLCDKVVELIEQKVKRKTTRLFPTIFISIYWHALSLQWIYIMVMPLTWFVWLWFIVPFEIFSLIAGEGLQILTYALQLWSLSCHIYCDTGHPFIMVISENPWNPHLLPSVWHCLF